MALTTVADAVAVNDYVNDLGRRIVRPRFRPPADIVDVDIDGIGDGDGCSRSTSRALNKSGDLPHPPADRRCMLSFQKLDVYQCSIEFVPLALQISTAIPRGYAELKEQLRRASMSVPLNIAEGAGRMSAADGARHYAIARGSAMECAAVLDVLRAMGALADPEYWQAMERLGRIVAMLTKLAR